MPNYEITPGAVKAAWKMIRTILPRYSIGRREGSVLLTLTTAMALQDLRESGSLQWTSSPPFSSVLILGRDSVAVHTSAKAGTVLKQDYSERELQRAIVRVEQILDRHRLPEEERDALFTALPCLGLHALADYLHWKTAPPFLELG